jgi:hypothetical protein
LWATVQPAAKNIAAGHSLLAAPPQKRCIMDMLMGKAGLARLMRKLFGTDLRNKYFEIVIRE